MESVLMENKKLYQPLPENECINLTISKSKIQGLGLFTKLFAPKGVNFGVSHYKIKDEIIRTPLGGFINHSDNPNCEKAKSVGTNYNTYNLIAIRDIKAWEEITLKYTFYKLKNENDFLENAEKEKKELAESYRESRRQTEERKLKEKTESEKLQEDLEPIVNAPMMEKE